MTLFVMDTTLQKSFGMRCKELRAGLGCSQEQFANLIEMDRSYYASIEVGRRNVSLSNLKKIRRLPTDFKSPFRSSCAVLSR